MPFKFADAILNAMANADQLAAQREESSRAAEFRDQQLYLQTWEARANEKYRKATLDNQTAEARANELYRQTQLDRSAAEEKANAKFRQTELERSAAEAKANAAFRDRSLQLQSDAATYAKERLDASTMSPEMRAWAGPLIGDDGKISRADYEKVLQFYDPVRQSVASATATKVEEGKRSAAAEAPIFKMLSDLKISEPVKGKDSMGLIDATAALINNPSAVRDSGGRAIVSRRALFDELVKQRMTGKRDFNSSGELAPFVENVARAKWYAQSLKNITAQIDGLRKQKLSPSDDLVGALKTASEALAGYASNSDVRQMLSESERSALDRAVVSFSSDSMSRYMRDLVMSKLAEERQINVKAAPQGPRLEAQ